MEKIPTAEDQLMIYGTSDAINAMIEFAKLHVKAALERAYENAKLKEYKDGDEQICCSSNDFGDMFVLDQDSILNAYNLKNIK